MIAQATVNISPSQGVAFLKAVAQSLLRQGFRRQVYISSGQGPAPLTGGTLVREFFDEEHVPDPLHRHGHVPAEAEAPAGRAQQGSVRRALHHRADRSTCR